MPFEDGRQAGRALSRALADYADLHPVVVGLPRGGVPLAFQVAGAFCAPMDVLVVSKLRAPRRPGFALGAIAEDGTCVVNEPLVRILGVSDEELSHVKGRARDELAEVVLRVRGRHPVVPVEGRTVILVDDGLLTGASAATAARVLKRRGAIRVILAAPQATQDGCDTVRPEVDDLVLLGPPCGAETVEWRSVERETTDDDIVELLALSREAGAGSTRRVEIRTAEVSLPGELSFPASPIGVVLFAHGSGSSRLSPRNAHIARRLNIAGFVTLLFDLLSPSEGADRSRVFDIPLLAERLRLATGWLRSQPGCAGLPVGYFGASTGAAASLWAAAEHGSDIAAVVSRGGRPDLAAPRIADVVSPTLLVVGGQDAVVMELNEASLARFRCEAKLEVVPGATHLFEEPGALEAVAARAASWFAGHLASAADVA
jgi:predicted phosphoribosyltransferase/predicted alpha/beta-hydrolase family hydrolase